MFYFQTVVDFSTLMKEFRYGENIISINEWVWEIRLDVADMQDTPDEVFSLIKDHLRTKHHKRNSWINARREQIVEDTNRAYSDAYRGQYETDFFDFLERALTSIARNYSEGGTFRWLDRNGKPCDFYEADSFEVYIRKKPFYERFTDHGYLVSERDDYRHEIFEGNNDDLVVRPDAFDGSYGHYPNVKDEDICLYFDDYNECLNERADLKRLRGWIKNKVNLQHRVPAYALKY